MKHYDLYNGRDLGRIWRITPEKFDGPALPHLGQSATSQLVAALEKPDGWWRDTAQRLLYQRQDKSAIEPLRNLAVHAGLPQSRITALWTLVGLGDRDPSTLAQAVADHEPHVRAAALHVAEPVIDQSDTLSRAVMTAAGDADPRVRFHAALALGYCSSPESLDSLAKIARVDCADRWTRTAVLIAIPERSGLLLSLLLTDTQFAKLPAAADLFAELVRVVGIRHDDKEVAGALQTIGGPTLSPEMRELLLRDLADGLSRGGGSLDEQLDRAPESIRQTMNQLFAEAVKTAGDKKRKSSERVAAIHLLAFAPRKDTTNLFTSLLDPTESKNVEAAVIAAIAANDDPQVGPMLVKQWARLGPALRNDVLDALFRRPERIDALLDGMEQRKIPAGEIEPARRQALTKNKNESIRSRAEQIFSGQVSPDRQRTIERYTQAVVKLKGDNARGAVVFKTICFQCHGKAPGGERVGPDLAQLDDRSPPTLLVAILDPNREVKPIYVSYDLETVDGQDYLGVIANETANSVTIRRAGGLEDVILRARIKTLRSTGLSLMPDGLEAGINEQQMADLLQYLRNFQEH